MNDSISPEIDTCRHLYLRRLWEPQDNQLCIIVDEAVIDRGDVRVAVTSGGPIVVGPQNRAFQLFWPGFVAYSVTTENFTVQRDSDRIASGRLLVRYDASDYLEYVRKAAIYPDLEDCLGVMLHVQVICLSHIIDVASSALPEVQPASPLPRDET